LTLARSRPKKCLSIDSIVSFLATKSPSWAGSSGPLMCM